MSYIGYCGDDCQLCPRYIATKNNDVKKLKEAAALWKKVGFFYQINSSEEMICYGCASSEGCHYDNIRECTRERKISNCGKCDTYPCDNINAVFEKTRLYAEQCKKMCNIKDYQCLHQAFFTKKDKLDSIHNEYISKTEKS